MTFRFTSMLTLFAGSLETQLLGMVNSLPPKTQIKLSFSPQRNEMRAVTGQPRVCAEVRAPKGFRCQDIATRVRTWDRLWD